MVGPVTERIRAFEPNAPPRDVYSVPGANNLLRGKGGAWALQPQGAVWWIPFDPGSTPEFWPLAAPVKLARVVAGELWIRLRAKGSPWCQVKPDVGPSALRSWPWAPPELTPMRAPLRPIQQAWIEALQIDRIAPGHWPESWMLVGPEFVWRIDQDGQPQVGQGGFGYLMP